MQNMFRVAADALNDMAQRAYEWADWADGNENEPAKPELEFTGLDIVGIDFSTSVQKVSGAVIRGWDQFRRQVHALRPNFAVRAFGVNAFAFPLTRKPVVPRRLPELHSDHFRRRGSGRGMVEYGSAFCDYFFMAIGQVEQWGAFESESIPIPITISLLSDGMPNGGQYQADEVRPLIAAARIRGVRFKLVVVGQPQYWSHIWEFSDSLKFARSEVEIIWDSGPVPAPQSIGTGFELLSNP